MNNLAAVTTSSALPRLKKSIFAVAFLPALVLLLIQTSRAGSATWNLNADGTWTLPSNWTPAMAPNGPSDIATFGVSNATDVFLFGTILDSGTEVSGITFTSGASAFSIEVSGELTISGVGILNNSGLDQNFTTVGSTDFQSTIMFSNSAAAGDRTVFTNDGGITEFLNASIAVNANFINSGPDQVGHIAGVAEFHDTSGADNANFVNKGGINGENGGVTQFFDTSSAGNATFSNNGAAITDSDGGLTRFYSSSTAATATIVNNSSGIGSGGGTLFFNTSTAGDADITNQGTAGNAGSNGITFLIDQSSAGTATFHNEGGTFSGAFGGSVVFQGSPTAGDATFINSPASVKGAVGGYASFDNDSTAGNATFTNAGALFNDFTGGGAMAFVGSSNAGTATVTNEGSTVSGGLGGVTQIAGTSNAADAVLVANPGSNGGGGGAIYFQEDSIGGAARLQAFGNGSLDISGHNVPGVTVGSIEGSGFISLGGNNLATGSNNLDTTFSGVIQDGGGFGGAGGSLTKIGTGMLTLSGANTYSGSTIVNAGGLTAAADHTLSSGNVSLPVAGATLTLENGAANDYLNNNAKLTIVSGSLVSLDFTGPPDIIGALVIDGVSQVPGLYGGSASGATFQLAEFTGSGTLSVGPPNSTAELLNISTRMEVLTDDKVLIGGFIITGNAPKKVILRAIGPALADFGLNGVLADPVLELHEPGGITLTNDNWKEAQQAEIEATGFAPGKDEESAIVATLAPGAYTAIVSGKDGGTGIGLVEVYDLDQAADSTLANISTRGFVDTGDNVMIGGVIIGGETSQVLMRAIGPELSAFGVNGALEDTTLELHDRDGVLITSNDDWKETQQSDIEATGLAPTDDRESAILATLAPDSYTAIVRGKDGTTGVALVEVYNLSP